MIRLTPDQQLGAIAEALKNIQDPTDRVRYGTELLGKQYLELAPALEGGAQGLADARQAAEETNVVLGEAQVKALQAADEGWKKLRARFHEIAIELGTFLSPALTKLGELLAPDIDEKIRRLQEATMNPENKFSAGAQEQIDELLKQKEKLQKDNAAQVAAAAAEQGKGFSELFASTIKEITDLQQKLSDKATAKYLANLKLEDDATRTSYDKRLEFEKKVEDLRQSHYITRADSFNRLDAEQNTKDLQNFYEQNSRDARQAAEDSIQDLKKQFDSTADLSHITSDQMTVYAEQAARNMQDAFAKFLFDPFKDGLKGLLRGFIDVIRQIIAQVAAAKIFDSLNIGTSSKSNGNSAGGAFFGSLIGSLFGFANGGSFNVGGSGGTDSQLVAFKATPGEQVSVRTPGQQGGGGVSLVYNIDARGATTDLVQALPSLLEKTRQRAVNDVAQLIRRGAFA